MTRRLRFALVLLAFPLAEARAETAALEVEAAGACHGSAEALRSRLEQLLARAAVKPLWTGAAIEPSGAGFRVVLRTRGPDGALAEKLVTAPSCEEAADAAAVVLALALGRPRAPARPENTAVEAVKPSSEPPVPAAPARPVKRAPAERAYELAGERARRPRAGGGEGLRLSLATGADAGTLPAPTLFAAAGVSRAFSALELRGRVRYGLPAVQEEHDGGRARTSRAEFGAVELGACYGTSAELRVQACGGAELGVLRGTSSERTGGLETREDALAPRLSGVLAAVLSHRGGWLQPELEISGAGVPVGRDSRDSWLVLRVAAGAAVEF